MRSRMDAATLGQYSGYIAMLLAIAAMVVGAVNHKRCRSRCGRRELSVSLDIGPTTPTAPEAAAVASATTAPAADEKKG